MRVIDVLTEQEWEEVARLRHCMINSNIKSEIDDYSKEIHKILDFAEARYHASKEASNNGHAVLDNLKMRVIDVLTDQEQEEVARLRHCMVNSNFKSETDRYSKEIHKILDFAEARFYASRQMEQNEHTTITFD